MIQAVFAPILAPGLLGQEPAKAEAIVERTVEKTVDHGVLGETFAIDEKNLIEVIMQKLHKLQVYGKLGAYQQQIQDRVKKGIKRPTPVPDIVHTQTPRSYTFDPSIIVNQDLKDQHGRVFYQKGAIVNPLTIQPMTKPLLLIDGDDTDHLTWAFKMLKTYPLAKIILVKGAPLKIMQEIGLTIYFDQFGNICKKFGIKQVPALISQQDNLLLIQEMKAENIFETSAAKNANTPEAKL